VTLSQLDLEQAFQRVLIVRVVGKRALKRGFRLRQTALGEVSFGLFAQSRRQARAVARHALEQEHDAAGEKVLAARP
jgi:hypothetical protein